MTARQTSALAEVYELYGARVLALARRITGDATMAEDATQDVFVRLWREPMRYDPSRGTLLAFLLLQVRGRAIDLVRSDCSRRRREEQVTGDVVALDEYARFVEGDVLTDALQRLLAPERCAIELAFFGGLTYREVARALAVPEGTVKSRIRSGLQRLREELVAA
jgi:RNA polymerase sigma-70 factor (ECF subfamily)